MPRCLPPLTEPANLAFHGRMKKDFERPSRENCLAGTLLGMLAMARRPADPALVGTLRVLESLQAKHRLVLSDVQERWSGLPDHGGHGPNAIVRCIPLMLWLRGPDHRLTAAALYLASAQEEDMDAGIGSALMCHWLRALYRSRSRSAAWASALERTQASLADLGLEAADTAPFMLAVGSAGMATTHPVAHILHSAHEMLSSAESFPDLARRLQHPATPAVLQLLAGAAGGMWFGDEAVEAWLGASPMVEQSSDARLAIARRCSEMPKLERWPTQTSESHPLPIAVVQAESHGRIGLSPCPGLTNIRTSHGDVKRSLGADLDRISAWGAKHVVCLLRGDDLADVGLGNYGEELRTRGIRLWHLPFMDGEADDWFEGEWRRIRPLLGSALLKGDPVLIHQWDWDEGPQRLAAELLLDTDGAPDLAQASSGVQVAIALPQVDASRLDSDE